jgi:alcohol dehydrogenase
MIPNYYEFYCPVKIVSGTKALSNLPYEMDQLGAHKALIVTDQGVVSAGLLKTVQAAFEGSNCAVAAIFDQTPVDSSNVVCNQVAQIFREKGCECFVALGGGSVIDTVKGANIVVSEGTDDLLKYQGHERVKASMKPFIVIPTTAGTGSEATLVAVIANVQANVKMSFTSDKLYPHVAILDPKMLVTMPKKITAATGMDALTHAIEGFYCLQKNPVSDAFSIAAIRLVRDYLVKSVENPGDETARLAMANAALCGGISFSNSLVGIVHSMAHAAGGVAHIAHGVANAILLPWGMEYNLDKREDIIAETAPWLGAPVSGSAREQARAAIKAVRNLSQKLHDLAGLPVTLKEAGLSEDKFEAVAKAAVNDGTMNYNPKDATVEEIIQILKKAY